jgi:mono/diheme cytochrome c family protein
MSGLFRTRRPRPAALVLAWLVLPLCGCGTDGKYPSDLHYPLRTDLIYVEPPTVNPQPFYPSPPGHLDQDIATINDRKGKTLDPRKLDGGDRATLRGKLEELFGTPRAPKVEAGDDDMKAAVTKLQLDEATLAAGSVVYRRHCLHCHGVAGDGRGPTGPWLSPHPRDYRLGKFKFVSSARNSRKPRRADLVRTVRTGIDGSSMPSFALLTPEEQEHVVSYVIHLSLRGEVEQDTMRNILTANSKDNLEEGDIGAHCESRLKLFLGNWASSEKVEEPPPYTYKDDQLPESIKRGYALFTNTQGAASCIGCHLDYGRQVPFRYDDWGTLVRPANLTTGVYRGGRRPIDLYWRIRLGVPPSQMPAADLKREGGTDEYWDLVNFVQALPYPQMLPDDIRKRIYPEPTPTKGEHAQAR